MKLIVKQTCSCCGKEFKMTTKKKYYKWQLDNEMFCSYTCYSKVFDSKYKASKTVIASKSYGSTKGRVVDGGYERHGSR